MFVVKGLRTRTALKALIFSVACSLATLGIPPFNASPAQAAATITYDYESANQLTNSFNSHVELGASYIAQRPTGGINNSGSIGIDVTQTTKAVYATKSTYSIGSIGSAYEFVSYAKSEGGNGYTGFGFTALMPSRANGTDNGGPWRPTDALGISVHGGGFIFHNGATSQAANWTTNTTSGSLVPVKATNNPDLIGNGSPDKWSKIVLKLTRVSAMAFDARIEIWPSYATGVLINPNEADAIFEWQNIANPDLIAAPAISSYLNLSGKRMSSVDNYTVNLGGNVSVIEENAPVVLTTATTEAAGVVNFTGDVTAQGGSAVVEKGFVFDTAPDASVGDNKVAVGAGTGTISGTTSQLPNGDYYFRAFATNSTKTSYGSENLVTISAGAAITPIPSASASATTSAAPIVAAAPVAVPRVKIVASVQFDGNSNNNNALAKARAKEVRAYLKKNGLADATFTISSKVLVGKLSNSRASMITVTYPGQVNKKKIMTSTYYLPYSSKLDSVGKKSLRALAKKVNANR